MSNESEPRSDAERAEILFGETMNSTEQTKPAMSPYRQLKVSESEPEDVLFKDQGKEPERHGVFDQKESSDQDDQEERPRQEDNSRHSEETEDERIDRQMENAEVILDELELDPSDEMSGPFAGWVAARDLSADDARELAEMHQEHNDQQWQKIAQDWRNESIEEFGDDLAALRGAQDLIAQYGDDELAYLMDTMMLGNHPAIIRFLTKVAAKKGR